MKASAPRAHGLDTLRALAIVSVIAYHETSFHQSEALPAFLVPIAQRGWMGVDLFFVLSGYLIASQFLRTYRDGGSRPLWAFYRNRIYRILPVFGVVLALYLAVPVWRESPHLPPLWQFLTFTQNLFVDRSRDRAFSHVWSLCVEEHFYLFFPLIALVCIRKRSVRFTAAILVGLVLAGMLVRSYFLFHLLRPLVASGESSGVAMLERIYYPTYSHLDGLLAGVTLAVVRTLRPETWSAIERRGHALFVAGACLVAMAVYLTTDFWDSVTGVAAVGDILAFPVLSLGLGLLVASAVSTNGWLRIKIPGAQLIATLAYSLYLTHKELIHLVGLCFPAVESAGGLEWLAVYGISCLVAASVLYLMVERPFLLLRDRRYKQGDRGSSKSQTSREDSSPNERQPSASRG